MSGTWIKPKPWPGKDLKGRWEVTLKVDGIQARLTPEAVLSRAGKPLYNMDHLRPAEGERIVEVFRTDWATSSSMVRTHNGEPVLANCLYDLHPHLDGRLICHSALLDPNSHTIQDPSAETITALMEEAIAWGWEGLVIKGIVRGAHVWYKVKPSETYDVRVTGIQAGTGKHEGKMGALLTTKGKVGTGFTDAERLVWWHRRKRDLSQYIIEVDCMGLTPGGKFRHPRYMRQRFDKNEEG